MGGIHNFVSGRLANAGQVLAVVVVVGAAVVFPPVMSAQATVHPVKVVSHVSRTIVQDGTGPDVIPARLFTGAAKAVPVKATPKPVTPPVIEHTVVAAPAIKTVAPPVKTPVPQTASASSPNGYGCASALSYLEVHAAPGFKFECPGWADGHQAMTCMNVAGVCPGANVIAISVPCAAAYMNEASNSWVLTGKSDAPIDPYGYCMS
jgi:hypothetical protein